MARPLLELYRQIDSLRIVHAVHSPERPSRPRQRSPPRSEVTGSGPKYSPLLVQSSSQPGEEPFKDEHILYRLRPRPLRLRGEQRRVQHTSFTFIQPSERIHGLPGFSRRTARMPSPSPQRPVSLSLYTRPRSRPRPVTLLKQEVVYRPPKVTVTSRLKQTKL